MFDRPHVTTLNCNICASLAAELLLTGRNIPAQEALQLGLLNAVVPDDQVDAKALEFAKAIAANSPDSIIVLMHGKHLLLLRRRVPKPLSKSSLDHRHPRNARNGISSEGFRIERSLLRVQEDVGGRKLADRVGHTQIHPMVRSELNLIAHAGFKPSKHANHLNGNRASCSIVRAARIGQIIEQTVPGTAALSYVQKRIVCRSRAAVPFQKNSM